MSSPNALAPTPVWFAVLCIGRSGSTYLTRLLDSHPRIRCLGEAFGPGRPPPFYSTESGLSRRDWLAATLNDPTDQARGFKLPIEALFEHPGLPADLDSLNGRVVHLRRDNKLARFVSMKLAQLTGQWSSTGPYAEQRIDVEPWELLSHLYGWAAQETLLGSVAASYPNFSIAYEELADAERLAAVQRFLGVEPNTLSSNTRRGRTVPLRESITNLEQVRNVIRHTPFAAALERWIADPT